MYIYIYIYIYICIGAWTRLARGALRQRRLCAAAVRPAEEDGQSDHHRPVRGRCLLPAGHIRPLLPRPPGEDQVAGPHHGDAARHREDALLRVARQRVAPRGRPAGEADQGPAGARQHGVRDHRRQPQVEDRHPQRAGLGADQPREQEAGDEVPGDPRVSAQQRQPGRAQSAEPRARRDPARSEPP